MFFLTGILTVIQYSYKFYSGRFLNCLLVKWVMVGETDKKKNLCELSLCCIKFSSFLNETLWICCLVFRKFSLCQNHQIQFLFKWTSFLFDSLENGIGSELKMQKCHGIPHFKKKKITENFTSIFMTWWENQNLKLQGQMYFPERLNYCSVWWQ